MLFSTLDQARVFLWMTAAGALTAGWYACLAALRRLLGAGVALSLALDAVFGVGAAALFCGFLVSANYGRPRLYALAGATLGFALAAIGLFPPAKSAIRFIAKAIRHIFVKIGHLRWIKVIFR